MLPFLCDSSTCTAFLLLQFRYEIGEVKFIDRTRDGVNISFPSRRGLHVFHPAVCAEVSNDLHSAVFSCLGCAVIAVKSYLFTLMLHALVLQLVRYGHEQQWVFYVCKLVTVIEGITVVNQAQETMKLVMFNKENMIGGKIELTSLSLDIFSYIV